MEKLQQAIKKQFQKVQKSSILELGVIVSALRSRSVGNAAHAAQ
jgi:hypothetical protein